MAIPRCVIVAGLVACVPVSTGAQTVDTPCGSFDLYPEYLSADTVTVSEDQISLGDSRIVQISLVNSDRDEVATFITIGTVVPERNEGQHTLLLSGQMLFADGAVGVTGICDRPNITSLEPECAPEMSLGLHSGTGEFAGYVGEIRLTRDDDNRRVYSFDFPCR